MSKKTLYEACYTGDLSILKERHEAGEDIHYNNDLLLKVAFMNNRVEIAKYLIENKCDKDIIDEQTIGWCEDFQNEEILEYWENIKKETT